FPLHLMGIRLPTSPSPEQTVLIECLRKNSATQYKNGVVADVDVAISEVIGRWQAGVAGYYARQFTDDRMNGQPVPSGNRFASAAVGPVVAYNIPECKCSVKFKAQFSVFTRNSLAPNAAYLFFSKAFN
ncbi:transporter, partial [Burkholderia contaminans]